MVALFASVITERVLAQSSEQLYAKATPTASVSVVVPWSFVAILAKSPKISRKLSSKDKRQMI